MVIFNRVKTDKVIHMTTNRGSGGSFPNDSIKLYTTKVRQFTLAHISIMQGERPLVTTGSFHVDIIHSKINKFSRFLN